MRNLALLAVLFASAAFAQEDPSGVRTVSAAQSLTQSAPTLVTEGLDLNDVEGFRVTVCAASGQTLSGAGSMQAYLWDNDLGLWARNPDLDFNVTATTRCQVSPDFQVMVAAGRVYFAATGVTVSSGTLTVQHKAWAKRGAFR